MCSSITRATVLYVEPFCYLHKILSPRVWERFFSIFTIIAVAVRWLCVPHPKSHIRWAFQTEHRQYDDTQIVSSIFFTFMFLPLSFYFLPLVFLNLCVRFCCCHCCGWFVGFASIYFFLSSFAITNDLTLLSCFCSSFFACVLDSLFARIMKYLPWWFNVNELRV